MESKNIIIILVVVVLVLAAAMGVMFLNQTAAKEPTKIKITSDKEQFEGGKLSIQLTDLNKTPISKQVVNITIKNSKGKVVVDDVVKTNSKGKANLDLDLKKGKYNVTVSFGGNENYTASNTTQKLTIKEEVVEEPEPVQQSYDNSQATQQEPVDYNSPDSEYYRWDSDGSFHKKKEGVEYIYAQDAVTGEWSYWADKR